MRCVPRCLKADRHRVGIAVRIHPLSADLFPKWMIRRAGDSWRFQKLQRIADPPGGNLNKLFTPFASSLGKELWRPGEEERTLVPRGRIVQIDEQTQTLLRG